MNDAQNNAQEQIPVSSGRAVVAMSGGVDSSVVAAMLHNRGEDVVGVSMRLYSSTEKVGKSCC
ncbi:MAG: tRNA-specific 2-thiouridylase, partial [Bradymonadia bacterium]